MLFHRRFLFFAFSFFLIQPGAFLRATLAFLSLSIDTNFVQFVFFFSFSLLPPPFSFGIPLTNSNKPYNLNTINECNLLLNRSFSTQLTFQAHRQPTLSVYVCVFSLSFSWKYTSFWFVYSLSSIFVLMDGTNGWNENGNNNINTPTNTHVVVVVAIVLSSWKQNVPLNTRALNYSSNGLFMGIWFDFELLRFLLLGFFCFCFNVLSNDDVT